VPRPPVWDLGDGPPNRRVLATQPELAPQTLCNWSRRVPRARWPVHRMMFLAQRFWIHRARAKFA
jgi:hypothetical protein